MRLANADRYARQTIFAPIGSEGQDIFRHSRVLIVGCGALGSTIANLLVRGGIGFVRLVDRDTVEMSNLQRQSLFSEEDAGTPKALAAAAALRRANSEVEIDPHVAHFDAAVAEELIGDVDLVLDGTDNFETRYLINDVCVKQGKAWIYAAVVGATGVTMTIAPRSAFMADSAEAGGPCFRCAFPEPPPPGTTPTCETAGILGAVVDVIGGWVVAEAFKLLLRPDYGHQNSLEKPALAARFVQDNSKLNSGLLSLNLWSNVIDRLPLARDPDCPACGRGHFAFLDADETGSRSVILCGRNAVQVTLRPATQLDLAHIAARLRAALPGTRCTASDMLVRFAVDGYDISLFRDGRAIIKGTDDPNTARTIYARYIGL